jgi:integrase
MKKRITDKYLESLQRNPPNARLDVGDETTPGLVVRATPAKVISFTVRYTPKGGTQQRETVGVYPKISLAYARQRAMDIAAAAARGIDLPAVEAAKEQEKEQIADRPATVGGLVDRYITDFCNGNHRRAKMTARLFEMHVKPAIGDRLLTELRRADIIEMLDDLQNKKGFRAQVNRVRSHVRAALDWAVEREWIEVNAAAGVKRRKIEAARERVLDREELRSIWRATEKVNGIARAFVRMLVLTGQRRDEIRCMEWSEINLAAKTWTLPARRNKGKRDHTLPLSDAMVEVLESVTKNGPYVFSVSGGKPYSSQKRLKQIIDREADVTGWVWHDVRRTVRSGLGELRIPEAVAERILNHAQKTLDRVYNRHSYRQEMHEALTTWAKHVAFIVGDARDAGNVARFPGAAATA